MAIKIFKLEIKPVDVMPAVDLFPKLCSTVCSTIFKNKVTPLYIGLYTHTYIFSVRLQLAPGPLWASSGLHELLLHVNVASGQNKHFELRHCCYGLLKEKKCRLDRS